MSMTVEEFASNLLHVINAQNRNPVAYVTVANLANDIQAALVPRDDAGMAAYPRMMYRLSTKTTGEDETLIVQNVAEEQLRETQGWRTTPTPKPPGYPQYWVENPAGRGTQYRRVMLRNPSEEQLFRQNATPGDWIQDNYPNPALGGTPVPLSNLVEERRQQLHRELEEELRNPVATEDENAGDAE